METRPARTGMLTSTDAGIARSLMQIKAEYAAREETTTYIGRHWEFTHPTQIMAIGEICSRDVVIGRREDSVRQAAELMRQHHVGDIVVVEELTALARMVSRQQRRETESRAV